MDQSKMPSGIAKRLQDLSASLKTPKETNIFDEASGAIGYLSRCISQREEVIKDMTNKLVDKEKDIAKLELKINMMKSLHRNVVELLSE